MKIKLLMILSIFLYSCTKSISIADPNINYAPVIESVSMDSLFILSETDTTFLEMNLFVSDQDGFDDIDSVIYYVKREEFYIGIMEDGFCEYTIQNDDGYITTDQPFLFNTDCYGDYDLALERVCEELTQEECENSSECSINDSDHFLYYTFQLFKPSEYPHCGGFGTVKFQFQVTDSSGLQDISEEIIVEILP